MKHLTHKNQRHHKPGLILMSLLAVGFSAPTHAETTECTVITTLPTVITTQGVYCLKSNLSTSMTSGRAIDIQTNNVTIDFNGFKLGGLQAGAGTSAYGVYAAERKNITLRNGNIRGFQSGIRLESTDGDYTNDGGHVIENNRLDSNTYFGIWVDGSGNRVSGNQVRNTGGTTVFFPQAVGIDSGGPGMEIINNKVDGTFSQGSGTSYGVYVQFADAGIVMQNRISQTTHSGTGFSRGVYRFGGTRVLIKENEIINATQTGTTAIVGNSATESFCRDNTLVNYTTGLSSCKDSGGNVTE